MARLSALFTRFLQSLLAKGEGVIQTYMDDPLILLANHVQAKPHLVPLALYGAGHQHRLPQGRERTEGHMDRCGLRARHGAGGHERWPLNSWTS